MMTHFNSTSVRRSWSGGGRRCKAGREKSDGADGGLRAEVQEDSRMFVGRGRPEDDEFRNWWDRHERAMERSADDIEGSASTVEDEQPPETRPEDTAASPGPFDSRRDQS